MRRGIDYYILLFFVTSFIGWIWEVLLYLFWMGEFINRGVYHGPYLPIYGFACVGMCLWLKKYRGRWLASFLIALVFCTILEYISSWYLEWMWGCRWWDYTEYFCNINGRVCLAASLGFGIGGMLFNCVFMKCYNEVYARIPSKSAVISSVVLVLILTIDAVYSGMYPHIGYGIGG
ncbi:MAG: putative ABC transporter permease [Lachnospiraceae bacterium]|nr:putative ABC transporter permease [Lachnospiraceae bacterium]MBQ8624648.1 putative ABC transporter permease [Agathobacter sp.]